MESTNHINSKVGRRTSDFPELQVGFPERNDASNPILEMERIHVDLETLDISRKNASEVTRAIIEGEPLARK